MADLKELQEALRSAVADGGQHKVFFYAAKDKGAGLRHGFIAVVDGKSCQLNFEQLDNERALTEIVRLKLIKVQNLPMIDQNPVVGTNPLLNASFVLKRLDPDQASIEAVASPVHGAAVSAGSGVPIGNPVALTIAALSLPANVNLSHMRLKEEAVALLETYYGHSAPQKVAEAEAKFPPATHPAEFLNACRQSAAVLIGMPKATEVFKGLYDTLG